MSLFTKGAFRFIVTSKVLFISNACKSLRKEFIAKCTTSLLESSHTQTNIESSTGAFVLNSQRTKSYNVLS